MLIIDKLEQPRITTQSNKWQFFTDTVMGGLSTGETKIGEIDNIKCYQMKGNVTTENNGILINLLNLIFINQSNLFIIK